MPLKYGDLRRTHPDYDAGFWARCEALYAGGRAIRRDRGLFQELFPQHTYEKAEIYLERLDRAFYVNYCSEIVDHLVSALFASPLKMEAPGADPFYAKFYEDTSKYGGAKVPLNRLLRQLVRLALVKQCPWVLVDFPVEGDTEAPKSEADQEQRGLLDAYAVIVEPESVLDYECGDDGRPMWANVCVTSARRTSWEDDRSKVIETYTRWLPDGWERVVVPYQRNQRPELEMDVAKIPGVQFLDGPHSFGAVPLIPFHLPEGLWAMGKLEGPAREHFNQYCALSWAKLRSLFPQLYEFLGPEEPVAGQQLSQAQQDVGRAVSQTRGMGYVQKRGKDDRAEYVGPDSKSFDFALQGLERLRDEMHRVMYLMALSVDNKATNVARSGESKAHDRAVASVVLTELGSHVRRFALELYEMVERGRQDKPSKWEPSGMESFDLMGADDAVDEMTKLVLVKDVLRSPTFWALKGADVMKASLGARAETADLKAIDAEQKANISAEEFTAEAQMETEENASKLNQEEKP